MANDSYKITDLTNKLVTQLDDQPTMGAAQLKARFDALGLLIVEKFNAMVEDFITASDSIAYTDDKVVQISSADMAEAVYVTGSTANNNQVDRSLLSDLTSAVKISGNTISGDNVLYVPTSKGTTYSVSLGSESWTGAEAPYTQEATVSGVTTTDIVFIEPQYLTTNTNSVNVSYKEAYNCIDYANVVTSGKVTFYCYEDKPETTLPLVIRIVR